MSQPTRDVAAEIGGAYLDAKHRPGDPKVLLAYERLQRETDRIFQAAVRDHGPSSVRIVFTRCRDPYASDRELIAAVRATHVLEITTAAMERAPVHPLLGCEYAGPFDRFRAVHDLLGHAQTGFGFELADEIAAWRCQDERHGELARSALATELLAINSARAVLGQAPEQKAILLDDVLLRQARSTMSPRAVQAR
jgi:hypothetical protein